MIPILFREAPNVYVVGQSMPFVDGYDMYLDSRDLVWNTDDQGSPASLAEFGGRICYGRSSFANKRDKTQQQYLQESIIEHNHGSVLEHVTVSFAIEGLSRNVLQELARHRVGTAFSVRSTRFADDQMEFAIPPLLRNRPDLLETFKHMCELAVGTYESEVSSLEIQGLTGTLLAKRKREAARHILPGALTCDLLFTCNARELRHIIQLRSNEHADLSFRELAVKLYTEAEQVIPELLVGAKVRHVGGEFEVTFDD